jgi:hypothetical protein
MSNAIKVEKRDCDIAKKWLQTQCLTLLISVVDVWNDVVVINIHHNSLIE